MCGIATIISPDPQERACLDGMLDCLRHRGPDDSGTYGDEHIALGHRRLSIIDLSPAGRQPLGNEDGTVWLVCNGEIYNYQELRRGLLERGHRFRSNSDSEVLVHLYEERGEELLTDVNGMFALVLWDARRRRLLAAVDRFGKKPLYYIQRGPRLALASEMKALLLLPGIKRKPNLHALDRYLSFRHVPAPETIIDGIAKLSPATMLTWSDGNCALRRYWRPTRRELPQDAARLANQYRELLDDAVRIRLNSDVPLGVYLSSGFDSSTIAALASAHLPAGRNAFIAKFPYQYDESGPAKRLAEFLGYQPQVVTIANDDFNRIPQLARQLDEPYGDLIVLPADRLAAAAKERVTVVLTGDGADETMAGYFHQQVLYRWERMVRPWLSAGGAAGLAALLRLTPACALNTMFDYPDRFGAREKNKLVQAVGRGASFGGFYEGLTSCFSQEDKRELYGDVLAGVAAPGELAGEFDAALAEYPEFPLLSRLALIDLRYWLPFILLYRLDRQNMAYAVETRSPFLDYRLVEFALNLPPEEKLGGGESKHMLRQLNRQLLPPEHQAKRKQAFYMPFLEQNRAGFAAWTGDMLSADRVRRRGLFRPETVSGITRQAAAGSMLANRQTVALAMLEQWYAAYVD